MNEFERRWNKGVQAARSMATPTADEAPLGFATRVVACWPAQPETSMVAMWQSFALRVLGVMAVVLLSLSAYGALSLPKDTPLQPPVENAVADAVWLL